MAIAIERIAQEKARGESTLATLDKERESLIQRQIEIQNQLSRDRKDLQQIGIDLGKTVILAPADGTILKLDLRNPAQVVRPGESVAQIAPSNASMVVKALEPHLALKKRGFRLEGGYIFSSGLVCTQRLSGHTFPA